MIADSTDPSYRGKAFGFHRAMDTLGACLGPLLAIVLLYFLKENLRPIFAIAFIPAVLAVLTLVFFLKEKEIKSKDENVMKFKIGHLSANFKRFLLVSSIFAIGNSSDVFLIMRSKAMGLSTVLVVFAYVSFNITYSILSTPAGALSDRLSRKKVMMTGYIIFAVVYLGFGLAKDVKMVWLLFPIYGFYMAMTEGVSKALVSDVVEKHHLGTALGLYSFATGVLTFFASFIAGLLWTHVGASAPFFYGAVTAAVSCLAFFVLIK